MEKIQIKQIVLIIVLVSILAGLLFCYSEGIIPPPRDIRGYYILPMADFVYNTTKESGTSFCYFLPEGYFQEALDEEELEQLVPDGRFPCSGTATWDGTGKLLSVSVEFEVDGQIIFVDYAISRDVHLNTSNVHITKCNGTQFVVYQYYDDDGITKFMASGIVGGQGISIQAGCLNRDPEVARTAFEKAVRWMSICKAKRMDASTVEYEEIPEYFYYNPSIEKAYADKTFGHMLPRNKPKDYLWSGSIKRFKNYQADYLHMTWKHKEIDSISISWEVSFYTQEYEENLIPSNQVSSETVNAKSRPVLKIEDTTVAILEAVKTDYGNNRSFNIIIGDYMISITSNAAPELLYDLLQQVRGSE